MKRWMTGLGLSLALLGGGAAWAGQCGYDYCWGAVGFGRNGEVAYSHGFATEDGAWARAQGECGGACTIIQTFYNTCGAIAVGRNGAWGFGWANSRARAESNAIGYCSDSGAGCRPIVWACSP